MTTSLQALVLGLMTGCGALLVFSSTWVRAPRRSTPEPRVVADLRDVLVNAGLPRVTPGRFALLSLGLAVLVTAIVLVVSGSTVIALCFGLLSSGLPLVVVRARAASRRVERRVLWPEAIDHLRSAVRAGLSLPEAVVGLADRGPEGLRPLFAVFAREYRATGRFDHALARFREASADPVADRIVAALAITRQVGGTDLGTMLGTLGTFLREDSRTRAELTARQSWTVAGARLAVAAPWIVLALLSTRPETARAYDSAQGAALLFTGLVVSVIAYGLMKRMGRLPAEPRVLR
ncbi:type II secretion system F family protein [Brevibacterium litoralis]|uniref:type II secretion system F family protein n=1 Tax=Brevibacterium litoralis TaxID=3138935 RepID=UPI0032EE46E4